MQRNEVSPTNFIGAKLRRYGLPMLLAIATLSSTSIGMAQCLPAPSGLIGWWPGDGNLADIFGGNNGTAQGGLTNTPAGFVSQAMSFDGANGYVSIPDSPLWHPTNVTVECWVKFTSVADGTGGTAAAGQQYIVFKQNTRTTVFEGFSLNKSRRTNPTREVFTFAIGSSAGSPLEADSTTTITAGTWYHVAGVRGSNFLRIYVNGQLQSDQVASFPQDYGNLPLYFGTSGQANWDRKFNGTLDEVSIYNRALSTTEIAAIYAAGAAGKCKGLSIAAQPQSRTNNAGTTATFGVTAAGSPPLTYQWLYNGEVIGGATATNLAIANVQSTNAGNYSVIITDSSSASLTSAVAVLTVIVPPSFTAQPVSATNNSGTTATFSATVGGSTPISYLWQHSGIGMTNGGRFTGVNTTNLQIANVQPGDAGTYRLVANNAAGTDNSVIVTLTVTGPPGIQTQPTSQAVTAGSTANFSVVASGTQPLSYQWQRNGLDLSNGGNIAGATSSALSVSSVTGDDAANYRVVITNAVGSITSQVAALTVNFPPAITTQPASQTAMLGTNVSFTVAATGAAPLRYQWRYNGANLANGTAFSGVTNDTLSLNYVWSADAGSYTVVITNAFGVVTSSVATLTVQTPTNCYAPPPGLIGWWPGDGNARDIVGTNHGIFQGGAEANGQGVVGQGFLMDGTNHSIMIPDSPQLHLPVLTVECWVKFRNLNGDGNSSLPGQQYMVFKNNTRNCNNFEAFVLSKDRTPTGDAFLWEVTSSEGNLIRSDSKTRVVTNTWYHVVGVAGEGYLEMYVNGVMETNVTFDFPIDYGNGKPLMFGSSGESCYDRHLDGVLDEVALYNRPLASNEVTALYANALIGKCKGTNGLFITLHPQDQLAPVGGSALFTAGAVGGSPVGYQWQLNGTPILGATTSSLFLTNVQANGGYRVVVTNASGTQTSASAALTVITAPSITSQPTNQTVIVGNTASFNVAASGTALTYQWRFNGTNDLAGQTTAVLTLPNVQTTQAGVYSVVVSNAAGPVTSDPATLTVLVPPYIMTQPVSETLLIGSTANFNVVAGGTGPFNYQWKLNGTNIGGANLDSLTILDVHPAQAGSYSVLVSSAAGSTNSAAAILATIQYPVLVAPAGTPAGPFTFTLQGDAGHTYAIEVSTNFQDWSTLTTVSNETGQIQFSDTTSSNVITRFYRARFNQ